MQDGKIRIAEDLTLSPQFTQTQFLASASSHTAQHVVNNSAYQAYSFTAQITDGVPCIFTLYFHADTLRDAMVYPLWTAPAGEWLDSQFALEQENRFRNDALLVTLLGTPPYSYSWGKCSPFTTIVLAVAASSFVTRKRVSHNDANHVAPYLLPALTVESPLQATPTP